MLVLSRQRDEKILIGDDVVICVVDIRGDKVRIGIDAPVHVPVHREEVAMAIRAEARRVAAKIGVTEVQRIAASFQRLAPREMPTPNDALRAVERTAGRLESEVMKFRLLLTEVLTYLQGIDEPYYSAKIAEVLSHD